MPEKQHPFYAVVLQPVMHGCGDITTMHRGQLVRRDGRIFTQPRTGNQRRVMSSVCATQDELYVVVSLRGDPCLATVSALSEWFQYPGSLWLGEMKDGSYVSLAYANEEGLDGAQDVRLLDLAKQLGLMPQKLQEELPRLVLSKDDKGWFCVTQNPKRRLLWLSSEASLAP